MACEICGYSYCNSSHSCPECARKRQPVNPMVKEHVEAGQQFGEGIIKIIAAFFLHPYLSLVGFGAIGFVALMWLAPVLGLIAPEHNPPKSFDTLLRVTPLWYRIVSFVIPAAVTITLRKYIRIFMKWFFIIGVSGLVIWAVVALTIMLINR